MTPLLPRALTEIDLPLAELSSARLDGELFPLGGSWCPVDALAGPETRAAAIHPRAPRRSAAERLTAAWIYGLCPEPARHQFCVDVRARTHKAADSAVQLREVRLGADDTVLLGRLRATTPLRTAVDLTRWGVSPGRRAETTLIAALLAQTGAGRPALRGISFSRIARAQLRDAFALLAATPTDGTQPSLTR